MHVRGTRRDAAWHVCISGWQMLQSGSFACCRCWSPEQVCMDARSTFHALIHTHLGACWKPPKLGVGDSPVCPSPTLGIGDSPVCGEAPLCIGVRLICCNALLGMGVRPVRGVTPLFCGVSPKWKLAPLHVGASKYISM
eukprot:scaffold114997_cov24-Tisochrysis_lutea.AAC.2